MKRLEWLGDSLSRVRDFPLEARREVGYQLERLQAGKEPLGWKPMPSIGLGVNELRVRRGGSFRVIYLVKLAEAIYVLHAFQKKSRSTARGDIALARSRLSALMQERREQWPKS